MQPETTPIYAEDQRFTQAWVRLLALIAVVVPLSVLGWGVVKQLVLDQPFGDRPMSDAALVATTVVMVALCGGVAGLLLAARLQVRVLSDGLHIRFFALFVDRRIPWAQVRRFAAVDYRPIRDYGGWGVRGRASNRAYNVSGHHGVRLLLADGSQVLVGSQHARELESAIATASGKHPGLGN